MTNIFTKKNKKGMTLVESVLAVVILSILVIATLSLLTAGGVKILNIFDDTNAHNQAVQKMDMIISAISNGSSNYITDDEINHTATLNENALLSMLGLSTEANNGNLQFSATPEIIPPKSEDEDPFFRGWYLTLTYKGATVTAFASNTKGDFDTHAQQ